MERYLRLGLLVCLFFLGSCQKNKTAIQLAHQEVTPEYIYNKSIHVFVALCDNKNQGIVLVPKKIGNGQDPANNLYWGCAFGVKTYFMKSKNWTYFGSLKASKPILERVVLKHKSADYYLIADAYDGANIKECTTDFLKACSGSRNGVEKYNKQIIGSGGNSDVIAYIGHNGLMDFKLDSLYTAQDSQQRKAIILACKSKPYFNAALKASGASPLLWTTQFMAPEAYTLHDAIEGFLAQESDSQIHKRAAKAYAKYQKCSEKAAQKLLATGY